MDVEQLVTNIQPRSKTGPAGRDPGYQAAARGPGSVAAGGPAGAAAQKIVQQQSGGLQTVPRAGVGLSLAAIR